MSLSIIAIPRSVSAHHKIQTGRRREGGQGDAEKAERRFKKSHHGAASVNMGKNQSENQIQ